MEFDDQTYKVILGLATGLASAVTIANVYLDGIDVAANSFSDLRGRKRFVDDGLCAIKKDSVDASTALLGGCYPGIKLKISGRGISDVPFLDLNLPTEKRQSYIRCTEGL